MAAKLLKLELIYGCMGKKLMLRTLFFAIALAAVSVLYAVHDAAPCVYISDCPDDFMVDFDRPRWPLIRRNSLQNVRDQARPEISEPNVRVSGGLGIESHPQIKFWANKTWREKVEFYSAIFRDLAARGLLRSGLKALCVGASSDVSVVALHENGLLDATAVDDMRSLAPMKADNWRLPFADNSFEFVFSGSFDRATVPALLASEIERTLKANGVAVMLVSQRRPNMGKPSNLMHSLSPVVALFKCSDVVHVTTSGLPNSQETTVIALRKQPSGVSKQNRSLTKLPKPKSMNHSNAIHLPKVKDYLRSKQNGSLTKLAEPRTMNRSNAIHLPKVKDNPLSKQNRSLTKLAEPLTMNHSNAIYLPIVKDISDHKRHIYLEIGGNSQSKVNNTVNADAGWFLASYPKQNQTFDTYALNSHANMSGSESLPRRSLNSIKQVVGDNGNIRSRERFDIEGWLSEMSVSDEDFVVVKMGFEYVTREMINKRGTGFMRLIDELFVQCSSELSEKVHVECLQFLQTLRDNGVFVHRW